MKTEGKEAILDVYNYAAKFDLVPTFAHRTVRRKLHRGAVSAFQEVTLELPERKIKAVGVGRIEGVAERNAASIFKAQAEQRHAEICDEALIIKDSSSLTAENSSGFLEFFKILNRGTAIQTIPVEIDDEDGHQVNFHRFEVSIDGKTVGKPGTSSTKSKAEAIALLSASITLKREDPELFAKYLKAIEQGHGSILKPISPIDMDIDEDCSLVMEETLLSAREAGLPDIIRDLDSDHSSVPYQFHRLRHPLSADMIAVMNESLQHKLKSYEEDPRLENLRSKRKSLPMNQYTANVLDQVNSNTFSIVIGATGSGKTTQVPQIILEDAMKNGHGATCNIICTQPRRIAATSVARRVAQERAEKLQDSIGYQVRGDASLPKMGGSVLYCTTGILLQQLQHEPDLVMDRISHIMVDEVHERDIFIDFLLIVLKRTVLRREAEGKKVPKVVLMSATIDTGMFAKYFTKEGSFGKRQVCPTLSVPGRTFPVKEMYLDEVLKDIKAKSSSTKAVEVDRDSKEYLDAENAFVHQRKPQNEGTLSAVSEDRSFIDWRKEGKVGEDGSLQVSRDPQEGLIPIGLIATTVAHIVKTTSDGAVLVFLPGIEEIRKVEDSLLRDTSLGVKFSDATRFRLYKLHSSVPDAQTAVFEAVADGCRKIILSTNIAETSVTIPEVKHIVDSGKLREKQYDQERRITMLVCTWISKSNAKQRAGRAGRVQDGNYYALYSKERHQSLRPIGLPEILRSDLQETCLDIKAQAYDTPVREFLAEALEPPSPKAVDASVINLKALDALTDEERITPLGRLLAMLPVHPSLGKMIVLGIIFKCLDPMLVLGAASDRQMFVQPLERRLDALRAKLAFVEGTGSDHIATLNAVRELRRTRYRHGESAYREYAHRNFISLNAFRYVESTVDQIEEILVEAGVIPFTPHDKHLSGQAGNADLNQNSSNESLIKALLLAGVHPNIAVSSGGLSFRTPAEHGALIHPGSTNSGEIGEQQRRELIRRDRGKLFLYSQMARSNDGKTIFLRDTSETTPLTATLFGGKLSYNSKARLPVITMDSWLPFMVQPMNLRTMRIIIEFRKALERLLAGAFRDLGVLAQRVQQRRAADRTIVSDLTTTPQTFLAEDPVSKTFADGLVQVLDRDVKLSEKVRRRGWGGVPPAANSSDRGSQGRSHRANF